MGSDQVEERMSENTAFLVARRRNEQHRNGAAWLKILMARTGLGGGVEFVEAAQSLAMQTAVEALMRKRSGDWRRTSGLSFQAAKTVWESCVVQRTDDRLQCYLHHSKDFAFSAKARDFSGRLQSLLDLDADSVILAASDLSRGVAVDQYRKGHGMVFETDVWGAW
jgi:hypothetical protein